jgi:hypothetical protein
MDRVLKFFITTALFFIIPAIAFACDIFINVEGAKKDKYKAGDVVIVKVEVILTHRNCPEDIDKTDIHVSGMQIVGVTKWVNTGGKRWERRIKVKVSSGSDGKVVLTAERTCRKDGGKGSLVLEV